MKIKQLALAASLSGVLGVGALGLSGLTSAQNSGGQAANQTTAQTGAQDTSGLLSYEQNTINVVNEYGPSVVSVNVTAQAQAQNAQVPGQLQDYLNQLPPQLRDFFNQQMQQQPQQSQQPPQQAEGSGFVIDQNGRMITNFHVVRDTLQNNSVKYTQGSSITVTFPGSETEYPVTVVGVNTLYDYYSRFCPGTQPVRNRSLHLWLTVDLYHTVYVAPDFRVCNRLDIVSKEQNYA